MLVHYIQRQMFVQFIRHRYADRRDISDLLQPSTQEYFKANLLLNPVENVDISVNIAPVDSIARDTLGEGDLSRKPTEDKKDDRNKFKKSLAYQAITIDSAEEKSLALHNLVKALRIQLARSVVLSIVTNLANGSLPTSSGSGCDKIASNLKALGLDDVELLLKVYFC